MTIYHKYKNIILVLQFRKQMLRISPDNCVLKTTKNFQGSSSGILI